MRTFTIEVPVEGAVFTDPATGKPVTVDANRTVTLTLNENEVEKILGDSDLFFEATTPVFEHAGNLERLHDLICEAGAREAADYLQHLFPNDVPHFDAKRRLIEARKAGGRSPQPALSSEA